MSLYYPNNNIPLSDVSPIWDLVEVDSTAWFRTIFINSFMMEVVIMENQSIDLLCKSMDLFLYDNGLRHERVNSSFSYC